MLLISPGFNIQSVFSPPHCLSSQSKQQLTIWTSWKTVKGLTEAQADISTALPHSSGCSFHCRTLVQEGGTSIASLCWILADDYWRFSCPSYAWKCFPELTAPSLSRGSRWGWLPACSSPWIFLRSGLTAYRINKYNEKNAHGVDKLKHFFPSPVRSLWIQDSLNF